MLGGWLLPIGSHSVLISSESLSTSGQLSSSLVPCSWFALLACYYLTHTLLSLTIHVAWVCPYGWAAWVPRALWGSPAGCVGRSWGHGGPLEKTPQTPPQGQQAGPSGALRIPAALATSTGQPWHGHSRAIWFLPADSCGRARSGQVALTPLCEGV